MFKEPFGRLRILHTHTKSFVGCDATDSRVSGHKTKKERAGLAPYGGGEGHSWQRLQNLQCLLNAQHSGQAS